MGRKTESDQAFFLIHLPFTSHAYLQKSKFDKDAERIK
jgi:hypothetical protein